jgi:preprotein translocase subunit SecG
MTTLIIVAHIIVCLFLICIVLLQHGKGADIGASFGGSNQSLFGAEGPMPLLNKITTLAAIVFMGTSITLAYLSSHKSTGTVMSEIKVQEQQAPAQQPPVAVPMPASPAPANDKPKGTPETSSPQ